MVFSIWCMMMLVSVLINNYVCISFFNPKNTTVFTFFSNGIKIYWFISRKQCVSARGTVFSVCTLFQPIRNRNSASLCVDFCSVSFFVTFFQSNFRVQETLFLSYHIWSCGGFLFFKYYHYLESIRKKWNPDFHIPPVFPFLLPWW